jgi:hypothetical protein
MKLDPSLIGSSPFGFERVKISIECAVDREGCYSWWLYMERDPVARLRTREGVFCSIGDLGEEYLSRYAWPEIGPLPALLAIAHTALSFKGPLFEVALPLAAEEVMEHETE